MNSITITYKLKWRMKNAPHYCWSACGKLFNTQRGNEIKKTLNGSTPGYWVGREFISLKRMKLMVEKIPTKVKFPF